MSSQPTTWARLKKLFSRNSETEARSLSRAKHSISRKDISPNALNVLYRLHRADYEAYLVGGGVRDLLLGRKPKDFDIVTNAEPEQICQLFSNSRLIGRRFQIVHVFYRHEIIEVSTFRAGHVTQLKPGIIRDDNRFGTLEEDVWRRDFTVNALYYNIADFSLIDYTQGLKDIKQKIIRMIGEARHRLQEDPVRMLRAIRLAAKLDFSIHKDIEVLFQPFKELLQPISSSRLFDEVLKLFFAGSAYASFQALQKYDFLKVFFPHYVDALKSTRAKHYEALVTEAMVATDDRYRNEQSLNPGFLFSVMLWPALQELIHAHPARKNKFHFVLHHAMAEVLKKQLQVLSIPKRLTAMMRDIWMLQYHLKQRRGKRVYRTLNHRYYRAAIDFMMLRAKVGEPVDSLVEWWKKFQLADENERHAMLEILAKQKP